MTKEKKKTIIFTIGLAVLALILMVVFVFLELRKNGLIGSSESSGIIKEFNEVYNSDELSVVFFGRTTCSYCELQKPILETIASDYDMEYFAIDTDELSLKQTNEIIEKLEIEGSTPTIVIVKNGDVVDTSIGYKDGRTLVQFLVDNKILPKDAEYSAEKYITFIDYTKYKSLIRSDDTHIIVVGQTGCSHCIAIKPALNSVAEDYDITINYLNLTELSEEESNKFFESLKDIKYDDPAFLEDGSFGTPLTLIVEDGKVSSYLSGQRTYSQLVRAFEKEGLIED